jgi:hypothetical protein
MLGIEQLNTIARTVTPIAMDIYDKENSASLLPLLAQPVTRKGNQKTVRLEWWAAFPQMRQWLDEKVLQKAFKDDMELVINPYEVTYSFDRIQATFDDGLLSAQDLGNKIAAAFALGKVLKAYEPMRSNEVTYDGQDFFDTDHTHPDDSTFTNKVAFNRGTTATPTVAEAKSELEESMALLAENSLIRNTLVDTSAMEKDIVVVTKSFAVWKAYNGLLRDERIGSEINRLRGSFKLLRDFDPVSGTEDYVDVIHAMPGGPRPSIIVIHQEVSGLQFGLTDFTKRYVPFGMEAQYAFGPGFPQTAVRVIPS